MTTGHIIQNVWVFISIDEDGDEGVVAAQIGGAMMPLVASDQRRVDILRPIAQDIAHAMGVTIEMRRFGSSEVQEQFMP